jgi:hypothetical protein
MEEHSENRVAVMKKYIGGISDEEIATDRWENEGGRTSTK